MHLLPYYCLTHVHVGVLVVVAAVVEHAVLRNAALAGDCVVDRIYYSVVLQVMEVLPEFAKEHIRTAFGCG